MNAKFKRVRLMMHSVNMLKNYSHRRDIILNVSIVNDHLSLFFAVFVS